MIQGDASDTGNSRDLLVERSRLMVGIILAATPIFAIADFELNRPFIAAMLPWKLLHVAASVGVLAVLRIEAGRRHTAAVTLAYLLELSVATVAQGVVSGDLVTAPILSIVLSLGTASILPWGFAPQLALAAIQLLSLLTHCALVAGDPTAGFGYPQLAALATAFAAVFIADVVERQRIAATEAHARRVSEAVRRSEERFALATRGANDGLWDWDLATGEVYFSPRWKRMLGFAADELSPRFEEWEARVHPDDLERFRAELQAHLDGVLPHFENEHRLERRDGTHRWMLARGLCVRDESGRPTRMAGSLTDISEQRAMQEKLLAAMAEARRAEEAARESEARFRQLGDYIHDILWIGNPDFSEVIYLSPAFEEIFACSRAEVYEQPRSVLERVHPEDRAHVAAALGRLARGRFAEAEGRIVRPDGTVRWIWAQGFPVRNERGEVYRAVGVWRDVTARKRAEEEREALLGVARDVSGTLERGEILARVQRRIAGVLPCDHVVTLYWDPLRKAARVAGHYGPDSDRLAAALGSIEFHLDDPITVRLAGEGTVVVNDVRRQAWIPPEQLDRLGIAAFVGTPLRVRGQVLGSCLAFYTSSAKSFDAAQVQLFEGIARHMALALEAVDLYRIQREDAHASAALARIGQEMIAALDTPGLLDRLCRVSSEALACDCSHTWLRHPEEEAFVAVAGHGDSPEQWEFIRLVKMFGTMIPGLVEHLERDGLIELSFDATEGFMETPVAVGLRQAGMSRSLFMALRRGGELIGMQQASYRERHEPFSATQLRIARGVAHLASLALEHARVVEELERANTVKAHFVATMSHELRADVALIRSCHDALLARDLGPLTPEQEEALRHAQRWTREAQELMDAALDVSRFESRRVPLDVREVEVGELLRELARETPAPADKPRLRLEWKVGPGTPLIATDVLKLKMILRNLVGNALKFTERGRVELSATAADGGVEFRVADTGIGIPPEALPFVFEPFHQAHGSTSRRKGGAGLGLYLVRRLADALGGRVEVESQVGCGSTFRLWLPRAPHDAAPGGAAPGSASPAEPRAS